MSEKTEQPARERRRNGEKLACIACGHLVSVVLPDRTMGAHVDGDETIYRRRRRCVACGTEFVTSERVEPQQAA